MIDSFLSRLFVNQWSVFLLVTFLLLILAEAGYRFGRVSRRRNPDAAEGQSGSIQGAILGLLGLLLGFSFAMAVGRYENRRSLVLEEANSIGTTWLRTDFLNSPHREQMRDLLVRYTRHRIDATGIEDPAAMARARQEIAGFHRDLWDTARAAVSNQPNPLHATFITSLNETIDLDASRMAAFRNHVPGVVWILLIVVAGCGSWASGYGSGAIGPRSAFSQYVFPILIGIVITLIADVDRPQKGLIGISQVPLEELLESMVGSSGS